MGLAIVALKRSLYMLEGWWWAKGCKIEDIGKEKKNKETKKRPTQHKGKGKFC